MSLITIFTTPKPFTNAHIDVIQRNALQSWLKLGDEVEVIVIGQEDGLAAVCEEMNIRHIPDVERNTSGTPMLSSIFEAARQNSQSPYLLFANADVILLPDVIRITQEVASLHQKFLIVGQRYDVDIRDRVDYSGDWENRLRDLVSQKGRLHKATGSDYFIFPRDCFVEMPDFAIGRAGWDNWMIYFGRLKHWPVVDATNDNLIIHQDHDYSHLPGGQPHYKLPETFENIRMAGGKRVIFTLLDVDRQLVNHQVKPVKPTLLRILRELEIFPLVQLRSYALAELFYWIFHPRKAYVQWRQPLSRGD
jgi:hypothetical protein